MQTSIRDAGMPAHVTARLLTTSCAAQTKWESYHLVVVCRLYPIINPLLAGCDCECSLFQDGSFMVRKSSGQDAQQPYTLVVFYKGRVYNIPIRFIAATQQYALGREKRGEEVQWRKSHFSLTVDCHCGLWWMENMELWLYISCRKSHVYVCLYVRECWSSCVMAVGF